MEIPNKTGTKKFYIFFLRHGEIITYIKKKKESQILGAAIKFCFFFKPYSKSFRFLLKLAPFFFFIFFLGAVS